MSTKVVFIAINYRTTAAALEFASRFEAPGARANADCKLILVDNSEAGEGGELSAGLRSAGINTVCVEGGGNLGYFGGARRGLETMRTLGWDPDWVVVSNVDLDLSPHAFIDGLRKQDLSKVGVVAPRISSSLTRRELNPFLTSRPSVMRMKAYKWIFRSYPTMLLYEWLAHTAARLLKPFRNPKQAQVLREQSIYAPHGSLIVLSREYFRRGGTLEHPPFLFGEEITIAETARALDLVVKFLPHIQVVHNEHASIGSLPSRRVHGFLRESSAFCADRYFSPQDPR